MQRLANLSRRIASSHNMSIPGAILDRIASRECIEPTIDLLVD
jgi:hypothetical protein